MTRYEVVLWNDRAWVVMADVDGLYHDKQAAFDECNNRNFAALRRQNWPTHGPGPEPRFKVGQRVRLQRIIASDYLTSHDLLGFEGVVKEVEGLSNGEFNYEVGGHYLNEYMLELAPVPEVTRVAPKLREVNLNE